MCVSVHMRVCGHLSVYTCVWTSVYACVWTSVMCVHVRATVCPSVCCVFMRVRGHLRVCVRERVDMYVQVWTCMCKCVGVGLRLSQAADSAEVSYAVASMTISIDAKCYYVLVFIRSRSTWGSFCFSAAFLFELVSMLGALKCIFLLCAFG